MTAMRYFVSLLIFASFAVTATGHTIGRRQPFCADAGAGSLLHLAGGMRPQQRKSGTPVDKGQTNAPAVDAPAVDEAPATNDGLLSSEDMRQLLQGNSSYGFMLSDETTYREYYADDGDIRGNFKTGKWTMKGNAFCTSYPGFKQFCAFVRPLENDAYAWESDGVVQGYMKVRRGNPFEF
jgi:hypothetical protein